MDGSWIRLGKTCKRDANYSWVNPIWHRKGGTLRDLPSLGIEKAKPEVKTLRTLRNRYTAIDFAQKDFH